MNRDTPSVDEKHSPEEPEPRTGATVISSSGDTVPGGGGGSNDADQPLARPPEVQTALPPAIVPQEPQTSLTQDAVAAAITAALSNIIRDATRDAGAAPAKPPSLSVVLLPEPAAPPETAQPAELIAAAAADTAAEPIALADAIPLAEPAPAASVPPVAVTAVVPATLALVQPDTIPRTSPPVDSVAPAVENLAPAARDEPILVPPAAHPSIQSALPVTPRADWRETARRALRIGGYVVAGYLALVAVLIVVYRFVNPPMSTLMLWRWVAGSEINQQWVPIEEISPNLIRAVVVSEDGRFCSHRGIDLAAIKEALERSKTIYPRGASTISMQVVKNVFLWPSKSYVRKVVEVPVTLVMELVWPKWRILEVYLNIAEWGEGVFGAEAAAQHHFRKPAVKLSEREAAQLAVSLPNPFRRDAGDPGRFVAQRAGVIQARARSESGAADCVLSTLQATGSEPRRGTGARAGL